MTVVQMTAHTMIFYLPFILTTEQYSSYSSRCVYTRLRLLHRSPVAMTDTNKEEIEWF